MKISIIIAAYNAEKYIERCLRSCLDQTMGSSSYEVIVVDDGSTDLTATILENFKDAIKVISLGNNMGLPYAANIGIQAAKSRFIVRVDSDDYIHSEFLNIGYLFLSLNHHYDSVAVDYLLVDEKEEIIDRVNCMEKPIACGIFYRKDDLVKIGLYDTEMHLYEDEDFKIRYEKHFTTQHVPLQLYRYRMHSSNMTKDAEKSQKYRKLLKIKHTG